jgi:hypothetical protein
MYRLLFTSGEIGIITICCGVLFLILITFVRIMIERRKLREKIKEVEKENEFYVNDIEDISSNINSNELTELELCEFEWAGVDNMFSTEFSSMKKDYYFHKINFSNGIIQAKGNNLTKNLLAKYFYIKGNCNLKTGKISFVKIFNKDKITITSPINYQGTISKKTNKRTNICSYHIEGKWIYVRQIDTPKKFYLRSLNISDFSDDWFKS